MYGTLYEEQSQRVEARCLAWSPQPGLLKPQWLPCGRVSATPPGSTAPWASAHSCFLRGGKWGALFTDKETEAKTGPGSFRPRALLGLGGPPVCYPGLSCNPVVGGQRGAGVCGWSGQVRGEHADSGGARCSLGPASSALWGWGRVSREEARGIDGHLRARPQGMKLGCGTTRGGGGWEGVTLGERYGGRE